MSRHLPRGPLEGQMGGTLWHPEISAHPQVWSGVTQAQAYSGLTTMGTSIARTHLISSQKHLKAVFYLHNRGSRGKGPGLVCWFQAVSSFQC